MRNTFLITDSEELERSILRYFRYVRGIKDVEVITISQLKSEKNQRSQENKDSSAYEFVQLFTQISNLIETKAENNGGITTLRESTIIIGIYNPSLVYRESEDPLSCIDSLLYLSFPEAHFINTASEPSKFLDNLNPPEFPPLFDPKGIRNSIRKKLTQQKIASLRERNHISASIDEEPAYAYLHGYLAYKIGYRNYTVTTLREFQLLGADGNQSEYSLVFEDLYLNFSDKHERGFSDLRKRDKDYPILKNAEKRILTSVWHTFAETYHQNKEYIQELKSKGKFIKIVFKPGSGIYNILEKSGLLREYLRKRKSYLKIVKKFKEEEGHSTPGRLLLIAKRLINRAEKIYYSAQTVPDCILGALLALEAEELLGYKTPTTSLEAIALKHKLEVKAECMFYGVEYSIDIKSRIKEIEEEIDTVSRWFNPKVKKRASLNARMSIIKEIMDIFKEYGQFDEEEQCLHYFRKLDRQWALIQPGWKRIFSWIIFPIRWYLEKLLKSFTLFIGALLFWPTLFSFLSAALNAQYEGLNPEQLDFTTHFIMSLSTFFGLQPSNFPGNSSAKILTGLLILLGFLHLGIFISYLYTLITKGRR